MQQKSENKPTGTTVVKVNDSVIDQQTPITVEDALFNITTRCD